MRSPFGHYEHLVRVAVLFAAAILAFILVQGFLVPDDFGTYGHYRAGALDDNRALPLVHAGRAACVDCHVDVPEATAGGAHVAIGCEACHGPLALHAEDPAVEPGRPDAATLCARCHAGNVARPAGFPQVNVDDHAGGETCLSCHTAHNPGME
jgi:hypothetical protein